VALRILNLGIDTATATGELVLTVMGGIAQFERTMMLERQREPVLDELHSGALERVMKCHKVGNPYPGAVLKIRNDTFREPRPRPWPGGLATQGGLGRHCIGRGSFEAADASPSAGQ
jgi:hypothetical protein